MRRGAWLTVLVALACGPRESGPTSDDEPSAETEAPAEAPRAEPAPPGDTDDTEPPAEGQAIDDAPTASPPCDAPAPVDVRVGRRWTETSAGLRMRLVQTRHRSARGPIPAWSVLALDVRFAGARRRHEGQPSTWRRTLDVGGMCVRLLGPPRGDGVVDVKVAPSCGRDGTLDPAGCAGAFEP